jgi:hypothetical protein
MCTGSAGHIAKNISQFLKEVIFWIPSRLLIIKYANLMQIGFIENLGILDMKERIIHFKTYQLQSYTVTVCMTILYCFVYLFIYLFICSTEEWTWDLRLARQALYHLSHTPLSFAFSSFFCLFLVGLEFELRAQHLQSRCSTP